ncbi:MAG: cysteine methyltransferase [Candidatus Altiarchaeales archaeon HGW-Altiarchaeales-3]|nr:MAG: cysteine methyltransferase [Candidatus Altiarchaeales archaeon HGW-Altiarchaeales-3]
MDFIRQVLRIIKQIPKGRVSTYGGVAGSLGDVRAARAVGNALNKNINLINIPCHRVVRSDGSVGGYKLGSAQKVELLTGEGLKIRENKILNFDEVLFKDFKI